MVGIPVPLPVPVRFNTRPLCDALARLDELAGLGALNWAERRRVLAAACGESIVEWSYVPEGGVIVARPAPWLADLLAEAGAR